MERAASPETRDGGRSHTGPLVLTVVPGNTVADPPRIVRVSDAFCAAFGYGPADLIGKPSTVIHGDRSDPETEHRFSAAAHSGEQTRRRVSDGLAQPAHKARPQ